MAIFADQARGWFALSREYPAALAATRMSGACNAIVYVIIARSFCLPTPQPISIVNRASLGRLLPDYNKDTVSNAIKELTQRNIIKTDGPERTGCYYLNAAVEEWEGIALGTFNMLRQPFQHLAKTIAEPPDRADKSQNGTISHEESGENSAFSSSPPKTKQRKLRSKAEKSPPESGEKSAFSDGLREEKNTPPQKAPPEGGANIRQDEESPSAQKGLPRTARRGEPERESPEPVTGPIDHDDGKPLRWIIRAGIAALLLDGEFPEEECIRAAAALANRQIEATRQLDGESYANAIDGVIRYQNEQTSRGREGVTDLVAVILTSYKAQKDGSGRFQPHFPGVRWSAWQQARAENRLPLAPGTAPELRQWIKDRKAKEWREKLDALKRQEAEKQAAKAKREAKEAQLQAETAERWKEHNAQVSAEEKARADRYEAAFTILAEYTADDLRQAIREHFSDLGDEAIEARRLDAWVKRGRVFAATPTERTLAALESLAAHFQEHGVL